MTDTIDPTSPCCSRPLYSERVFLLKDRQAPYKGRGLAEIARVSCCVGCGTAGAMTAKYSPRGNGRVPTSEEWTIMLRFRKKKPPFIFEEKDGDYWPENYSAPKVERERTEPEEEYTSE